MPSPAVSFRSVVALVDRFPVLAGVDLEIPPGDCVLVRGPNGAGKTSLLRVIASLLPMASGSGEVLGFDLETQKAQVRRSVGYLGHQTSLYAELTIEENLRFAARAAGSRSEMLPRALEHFGIGPKLAALRLARVSAGQRRRAALAALYVKQPELWLLDEPHTGLDAETQERLGLVISEAVDAGATVIFSSHETHHVELASRTITIEGGTIHSHDDGRGLVDLREEQGVVDVS